MRAIGAVTQIGMLTGFPLYRIAGRAYLFCDGVSWRIQVDDPRVIQTDALYAHGDVSELGEYFPDMGTPPGGTVS